MKYMLQMTFDVVNFDGEGVEVDLDELIDELEARIGDELLSLTPVGDDSDSILKLCNVEVVEAAEAGGNDGK